jgi:hypothetical protein
MEVSLVALQAQEWLVLFQQVVRYSSMGYVAGGAVLRHRWMIKDKRSLLLGVATDTEVMLPFNGVNHPRLGAVNIVT